MVGSARAPDSEDGSGREDVSQSPSAFNQSARSASSAEDTREKDRRSGRTSRAGKRVSSPLQHEVSGRIRQLSEGTNDLQAEASGGKRRSMVPLGGDYIRVQGRTASKDSASGSSWWNRTRKLASWLVKNHYLANASAIVVMFDTYLTCVDIDYRALEEETPTLVVRLSDMCLLMYTLELFLFLAVHGISIVMKLWRDAFFMIDVGVLVCGYGELVLSLTGMGEFFGRIGMLRLLRVARVLRLTRLLRKSTSLKELRRLLTMMATCMKALGWSFLICFGVMTFWAMLMVEIVNPIVKEKGHAYFDDCAQCLRATGSVMDANLLLFKTVIAGDSWGEIAVPVIEDHPETAMIFVGSQLTLVFGVLNLIVAVVVDTFAEARQHDVLNLAEELEQDMATDQKALQKIFNRIDADGSGEVTLAELIEGAQRDPEFRSRLQVMDIDEVDLQQLFEMIDIEGEGQVKVMEFVTPLSRWVRDSKTAPRFVKYNMMRLMHRHEEFVGSVDARFELLAGHLDEMTDCLRYLTGSRISESSRSTEEMEAGLGSSLLGSMTFESLRHSRSEGMLSSQMSRLSVKRHKTMEPKAMDTETTTELEWVEDALDEEIVEQPPFSKRAHLPSLFKDQCSMQQETLQMQEKALASAFHHAVEVLKQSLLDATDQAVHSSLFSLGLATKEVNVLRGDAHPAPESRKSQLRHGSKMRTNSRGRPAARRRSSRSSSPPESVKGGVQQVGSGSGGRVPDWVPPF